MLRQGALCLAEFLLGFILPVPVCLSLPLSGFLLMMMNPEKVPAFDLCIEQEQGTEDLSSSGHPENSCIL